MTEEERIREMLPKLIRDVNILLSGEYKPMDVESFMVKSVEALRCFGVRKEHLDSCWASSIRREEYRKSGDPRW